MCLWVCRSELLSYASILEGEAAHLCKFNLHLLACRLHVQERERGHVYHDTEMWVERMMQRCKRRTRYKNPRNPEKVMAMHICEELATQRLQADYPSFRDFDKLVPEYRDSPDTGPQFDSNKDTNTGTFLLHKGRRTTNNSWLHTACFLRGTEIVKGTSHKRAYNRDSSYVVVSLERRQAGRRNRNEEIARVRHFLRVGEGDQTERLVVVNVFQNSEFLKDADLGEMFKIREDSGVEKTLPVDAIKTKLLVAKAGNNVTYCLRYFSMSATS